jgi:2-iminoacetate synthase
MVVGGMGRTFADRYREIEGRLGGVVPRLARLLAPVGLGGLEQMAAEAARVGRRHFGRTVRLFAPLYLSNECVNNCAYCGFSRDNPIFRVTLREEQVVAEAAHLVGKGFRSLLLVAGEHPKFVSNGYLERCIGLVRDLVPSVALEVGPMEAEEYRAMVGAGCEALVVYQESYDRDAYGRYHTGGPKKDFDWRLECPERAVAAGFRRVGLGVLLGLADWRREAMALGAHLDFLQRRGWRASYTVSFPRLRPAAGGFEPRHPVGDREYVQLLCAFRIAFPEVGLVVSTREPEGLRDALIPLGVTHMSAGSHTEPGGYTGQGVEDLHLTVRGRRVELEEGAAGAGATEQFGIADERSVEEVAEAVRAAGLEPVWKDWDRGILVGEKTGALLVGEVVV